MADLPRVGASARYGRGLAAAAVLGVILPPRTKKSNGSEPLGFEDLLWKAADKLRGSMDASEYKHVVLGLIFLKYVDDAFEERHTALRNELAADNITGDAAE